MTEFALESTAGTEGTLWRAACRDDTGRLIDATRWTIHPRRAISDLELLRLDRYWVHDDQPYAHGA